MFEESEVEIGTDFVPKKNYNKGSLKLCGKCRYFESCPMFYKCKTIKRWEKHEDLDYDNSTI